MGRINIWTSPIKRYNMLILILMIAMFIIGMEMEDVHRKVRPILKETGIKLIFYVRYRDIMEFLNQKEVSELKKEKISKLLRKWIYLAIAFGLLFIIIMIIGLFFPSLVKI